eukprot:TRINITY_DN57281_c0_g1_i1.p1 TRINITY_DN57281_c0_g1~~TRINITY_DN57281_c0_g1_i1.p1  ORF type:complete len:434 (+),score=104.95 TRINITY_DN57281_c0_g1_i1:91-1392(+)
MRACRPRPSRGVHAWRRALLRRPVSPLPLQQSRAVLERQVRRPGPRVIPDKNAEGSASLRDRHKQQPDPRLLGLSDRHAARLLRLRFMLQSKRVGQGNMNVRAMTRFRSGVIAEMRALERNGSEVGVRCVTTVMAILNHAGGHSIALDLFQRLERKAQGPLSAYTLSAALTAHAGARDAAGAQELWERHGCGALDDRTLWNTLLHALARGGEESAALATLSTMERRSIDPDSTSYQSAAAACRSLQAAEGVIERMLARGMTASEQTLNVLLKACLADRDPEAAEAIISRFTSTHGVIPNIRTYNTLAACAQAAGDFGRVMRCMELLSECGLQPDTVTYGVFVMACADRCRSAEDEYARMALKALNRADLSGLATSQKLWGAVIQMYCEVGALRRAEEVRTRMLHAAVPESPVTAHHLHEARQRVIRGEMEDKM